MEDKFPDNLIKTILINKLTKENDPELEKVLKSPHKALYAIRALHSLGYNPMSLKLSLVSIDYFILGLSKKSIAKLYNTDHAYINELLNKAINMLKNPLIKNILIGNAEDLASSKLNLLNENGFLTMKLKDALTTQIVIDNKMMQRGIKALLRQYGNIFIKDIYDRRPEILILVYGFGIQSLKSLIEFFKYFDMDYMKHHQIVSLDKNILTSGGMFYHG